jgi:hypothetical protein
MGLRLSRAIFSGPPRAPRFVRLLAQAKPAPSRSQPVFLLFDRAAGFLSPRPRIAAAVARRRCQGWPRSGHRRLGLYIGEYGGMLVVSGRLLCCSSALDCFEHDAGSRWLGSRIEGSPHRGEREIAPATLYSVDLLDPDHDAHMRIGCEAPRRRAHDAQRHESHGFGGSPPPRTVIGSPLIERIAPKLRRKRSLRPAA